MHIWLGPGPSLELTAIVQVRSLSLVGRMDERAFSHDRFVWIYVAEAI